MKRRFSKHQQAKSEDKKGVNSKAAHRKYESDTDELPRKGPGASLWGSNKHQTCRGKSDTPLMEVRVTQRPTEERRPRPGRREPVKPLTSMGTPQFQVTGRRNDIFPNSLHLRLTEVGMQGWEAVFVSLLVAVSPA